MRKFKISVNGKAYEVEVEELGASSAPIAAPAAVPVQAEAPAAPAPVAEPKPAAPAPAQSAGGIPVSAPMPGTVLSIAVSVGSKVKSGDLLFILEAMKMENEILSPADGTVASINVGEGSTVESGAVVITLS